MEVVNGSSRNFSFDVRRVVFLGSPLIDITANIDNAFLQKYNLQEDSAYVMNETNRTIFEEIRPTSVKVGGSVTNTARIFQKFRLSPDTHYFGSIGNDDMGKFIKSDLAKEGLGADLTEIEGSTGKVAVLLRGKARTLITDLGVSRIFVLDDEKWAKMDEPSLIYLSGFFIGVSFEAIRQITAKNKTLAFNLGAPFLCTKFPEQMVHLYRSSSLIFGNESEHRAFAKILNITSNKVVDVVVSTNQRLDNRSRVVVVTRGAGPVLVMQNPDWLEFEVMALDEDKILDTNGAGDAFVGGFLARYVEGDSVANCVQCGVEVARRAIQTLGFNLDSFSVCQSCDCDLTSNCVDQSAVHRQDTCGRAKQ